MRTEITKRVTMEEEDLYRMVKAFLNVPEESGVWLRPTLNHDESILVGLSVQWIDPPEPAQVQP